MLKLLFILTLQLCVLFEVSAQKIGLQTYSLRNEFKENNTAPFQLINSWGIQYIEGNVSEGLSIQQFLIELKKSELQLVSTGAEYSELEQDPAAVAKRAMDLGVKYVVCYWIPHEGNTFGIQEITKAIQVFNNAGKVLKASGLTLCYHPHGFEFRSYQNGTLFDYMMNQSENFDFELDVYWVKHAGQDPLDLLQKYPTRFPLMHLKDRAIGTVGNQNGRTDVEANVILGQGDVAIGDLIQEAKKIGVEFLFIEDESSQAVSQIPESLAFARKQLK